MIDQNGLKSLKEIMKCSSLEYFEAFACNLITSLTFNLKNTYSRRVTRNFSGQGRFLKIRALR